MNEPNRTSSDLKSKKEKVDNQNPEMGRPKQILQPEPEKEAPYQNLLDNPYFKLEEAKPIEIVEKVKSQKPKKIVLNEELLLKNNFILTEQARERLRKCYSYIEAGVPLLLEGPTGTSKTLIAETICEQCCKAELIRFNLSSETKISDLLGKSVGDSSSWGGIIPKEGPFLDAFKNGKPILLDEINLASKTVLQCIEEALDSGILSIETPGMPLKKIKKKEGFTIIATQNPNKGWFANKRQDLGTKFLSKFQIITFPAFGMQEIESIALGLSERFGFLKKDKLTREKLIRDLVGFHMEWSTNPKIADEVQVFTVREIAATVKAFADGEDPFDAVMTIYAARYPKTLKDELKDVLGKYDSFKGKKGVDFKKPENFSKNCFWNTSIANAVKSIEFSIKHHRPVIISGADGCGKTQLAKWIAECYNKVGNSDDLFITICTEEIKCSDLIGRQKPNNDFTVGKEFINWEEGILTKGIKNGKIVLLDCIDEAPSTVTERLNSLLDKKYNGKEKMFDIPENPKEPKIPIHEDFNLICTCDFSKINQISPAFINRFDVVYLEDQISNLEEEEYKQLIKLIFQKHFEIYIQDLIQTQESKKEDVLNTEVESKEDEGYVKYVQYSDDSDSERSSENEESKEEKIDSIKKEDLVDKSSGKFKEEDFQSIISNEIIELIYKKKKNVLTIYQLSFLCRSVLIYIIFFKKKTSITKAEIVEFAINILEKENDIVIPKEIEDSLLNNLREERKSDDPKFFYKNSDKLKTFIARLYASSLINLHVCVIGPPGAGKTAGARAFARIRAETYNFREAFFMHSFHSATKPSHFYGTTTIQDGKISFLKGTLTNAMINGVTFIADELNLSSSATMKSLAPALEVLFEQPIFFPEINEKICIKPSFFFIACQNELGIIGRNALPSSIAKRFTQFHYPEQDMKDVQAICRDIQKSIEKIERKEDANNIGKFMLKFNEMPQKVLARWSFRDIQKIFNRISHQKKYPESFHNLKIWNNIFFYILSSIPKEENKELINDVIKLIASSFNLSNTDIKDLEDCYNNPPIVKEIDSIMFIMKGKCGISLYKFGENGDKDKYKIKYLVPKIPSLYNDYFNVLLSDDMEPILLTGPSGYKQFLSEQILKDSIVVSLNQESSIEQLLGSSIFLTKEEAKDFYLTQLCKILHESKVQFSEELKNGKLNSEKLKEITEEKKKNRNYTNINIFSSILDSLEKKIFNKNEEMKSSSIIKNLNLEFNPGLFLSAIFGGKSLILKNLSNLSTVVLERFNELFSGNHNLTLNEDIYNTFTTKENKELKGFSPPFRIFATCQPDLTSKLSEAVLSRFTVIYVENYKEKEKEFVLQNCISIKKLLNIKDKHIKYLSNFEKKYKKEFKELSLQQMIKIIIITDKMISNLENREESKEDIPQFCLQYTIYLILKGILETKVDTLKNIIDENFIDIVEETPVFIEEKNNYKGLASKTSKLFMDTPDANIPEINLAFTDSFNEMIEVLHFGLTLNIPVILEGPSGQGKQTAIKYIADCIGYRIINIIISKSTKVHELFSKTIIKRNEKNEIEIKQNSTKLLKVLKGENEENEDKKAIIVFHNINNASPGVLEIISSIFNIHNKTLLLPDGQNITKSTIKVIGIFNPIGGASKDKLPNTLINSSIYHIVKEKSSNILKVIEKQMQLHPNLKVEDKIKIFHDFIKIKLLLEKEGEENFLTLNDITKYFKLRESSFDFLDKEAIFQMVFAFRSKNEHTINKILKEINDSKMKYEPEFLYETPTTKLTIKIGNKQCSVDTFKSDIDKDEIYRLIKTLTSAQKTCLIFILCCYLSKRTCIIQGGTASGKSYIIRVFSKIMGMFDKLSIYQMNSETGMSILTGQNILKNEITEEEGKKLIEHIKKLNELDLDKIQKEINTNFKNEEQTDWKSYKEWKPINFKIILEIIEEYLKEKNVKKEVLLALEQIKINLEILISPAKRFVKEESKFIEAIKEGQWVIIDGLESAPDQISEKLSSLVGDVPELDIFEREEDCYFTKERTATSTQIHKNFYLFITYNPTSQIDKKIDQSLLNKCVTFTLPPMDSNIELSAQILYGSMINSDIPRKLSLDIATRMANVHEHNKQKSIKSIELFSGDIEFNGRTLIFIANELKSKKKELPEKIYNSFQNFYWNSYADRKTIEDFRKETFEILSSDPKPVSINATESNQEKNEIILKMLRRIQQFCYGKIQDPEFSFPEFIKASLLTVISQSNFVKYHINGTNEMISKKFPIIEQKSITGNFLSQIYVVGKIFDETYYLEKDIPLHKKEKNFKDEDLFCVQKINNCLSKLNFLNELYQKFEQLSNICFNYDFLNKDVLALLKEVQNFFKQGTLKSLEKIMISLDENNYLFSFLEKVIPSFDCYIENSRNTGFFWINLFPKLYKSKIQFQVYINNNLRFSFISSVKNKLSALFKFENVFDLNKDSEICFDGKKKYPKKAKVSETRFYEILSRLHDKESLREEEVELSISHILKEKKHLMIPPKNFSIFELISVQTENEIPLILAIWVVCYIQDRTIMEYCLEFLCPIHKRLFNGVFNILNQMKNTDIENYKRFTSEMLNYCKSDSILSKICSEVLTAEKAKIFKENEINHYRHFLDIEKTRLKNIYKIDQKIWSVEKDIKEIEKIEQVLPSKPGEQSSQIKEIRKKLEDFTLDQNETLKDSFIKLKQKVMKIIDKLSNQLTNNETLDEKIVEYCKIITNNFYKHVKQETKKNSLNWPIFYPKEKKNDNDNIKIMKILLDYSKIHSKLLNIEKGKGKGDILPFIYELNQYPEIENVFKILYSGFISDTENYCESIISQEIINVMFSTLRAKFLSKWIDQGIKKNFSELESFINSYVERNEIIYEYEIEFLSEEVLKYDDDAIIYLPKFEPIDLFYLFINYQDSKLKEYVKGPFLKNNEYEKVMLKLVGLRSLLEEQTSFIDSIYEIGTRIYEVIFCPDKKDQPKDVISLEEAIENKINSLKKQENKHKKTEEFLTDILLLIKIAEDLEKNKKKYEMNYDDIDFLKDENPFLNNKICSSYPSLIFFFAKHFDFCKELKKKYSNFNPENHSESIPLWLFTLRIVSSLNCISFEQKSKFTDNSYAQKFKRNLIDFLLINKKSPNLEDFSWVNLALDSVPPQAQNSKIKYLYDFINRICKYEKEIPKLPQSIQVEKKKIILEEIRQIFKFTIEQELVQKIYSQELNSQNSCSDLINFLENPNKLINRKLNKIREEKITLVKNSQKLKNLFQNFKSFNKIIYTIIDSCKSSITNEEELYNKDKREKEISNQKMIFNKNKIIIIESIREFNNNIDDLDNKKENLLSIIENMSKIKEKIDERFYKIENKDYIIFKMEYEFIQSSDDFLQLLVNKVEKVKIKKEKMKKKKKKKVIYNISGKNVPAKNELFWNKKSLMEEKNPITFYGKNNVSIWDYDISFLKIKEFNISEENKEVFENIKKEKDIYKYSHEIQYLIDHENKESNENLGYENFFIFDFNFQTKEKKLIINKKEFDIKNTFIFGITGKKIEILFNTNEKIDFLFKEEDLFSLYLKIEDWKRIKEIKIFYGTRFGWTEVFSIKNELEIECFNKLIPNNEMLLFDEKKVSHEKVQVVFKNNKIEVMTKEEYFRKITAFLNDLKNLSEIEEELNTDSLKYKSFEELQKSIDCGEYLIEFDPFFSDETTNDKIEEKFKEITNKISCLIKFMKEANDFLKSQLEDFIIEPMKTEYSFFEKDLSIKMEMDIKEKVEPIPLEGKIKGNIQILSTPFINNTNTEIIFSSKTLNIATKPLFPSLYSNPLEINILSFCTKPIHIYVKRSEGNDEILLSPNRENIDSGCPVKLEFKIPSYKNAKKFYEYDIDFSFAESKTSNIYSIKCRIEPDIFPISVIFSCKEYSMKFDDLSRKLMIDSNVFMTNEKITFNIKNYYLEDKSSNSLGQLQYIPTLQSLNNNQGPKPILSTLEKGEISLKMPNEKYFYHFQMDIWISNKFSIPVVFKGNLVKIDYTFEIYDFLTKKYVKNPELIIYYPDIENYEIDLLFKVETTKEMENMNQVIRGRVEYLDDSQHEISKEKEIVNKEEIVGKFFTGNKIYFRIKVRIQNKVKRKVKFKVNGEVEKQIELNFFRVVREFQTWPIFLKKFVLYEYDAFNEKWNFTKNLNENNFTISPFGEFLIEDISVDLDYNKWDPIFITKEGRKLDLSNTIDDKTLYTQFILLYKKKYWAVHPDCLKHLDFDFDIYEKERKNFFSNYLEKFKNSALFLIITAKETENVIKLIEQCPEDIQQNFNNLITAYSNDQERKKKVEYYNIEFARKMKEILLQKKEEIDKNEGKLKIQRYPLCDYQSKIDEIRGEFYSLPKEDLTKGIDINAFGSTYLVQEGEGQVPKKIDRNFAQEKLKETQKDTYEESQNQGVEKINPKIIKYKKEGLSLNEFFTFYSESIYQIRSLPVYIANSIINKNSEAIKNAGMIYAYFLQVFNQTPEKDRSILSDLVNDFNYSFNSLTSKLKKLGLILNQELTKTIIPSEDFLKYPSPYRLTKITESKWNIEGNNFDNSIENNSFCTEDTNDYASYQRFVMKHISLDTTSTNPDIMTSISNEYMKKEETEKTPTKITSSNEPQEIETNVTMRNFIFDDEVLKYIKDEEKRKEKDSFQEEDDVSQLQKQEIIVVKSSSKEKSMIVNSEVLAESDYFQEESGIKRAIRRIKEIDKKNELVLDCKRKIIPANIKEKAPKNTVFSINKLVEITPMFSSIFFKAATESEASYENYCANILLDCNGLISDENKAFNMMITCGLTSALQQLEIPYSIALIADSEFQVILKDYKDPHSTEMLQKVFECFMIKRYRCKLASSIKFAIEQMTFDPPCERNKRVFFVITNGLDEQLALTSQWKENIFNDRLNSFGFIFLKSAKLEDILTKEDLDTLDDHWNNFEIECKAGSSSNLGVSIISPKINEELFQSLRKMMQNVMTSEKETEINPKEIHYNKPSMKVNNEILNLSFFRNALQVDFSEIKEITAKESDKFDRNCFGDSKQSKVDLSMYKNIINKICPCKNNQVKSEEFNHIVQKICSENRKVRPFLEAIFTPNKAAQKVLSSTGTEFDITALILNLINPVPEPLIYLEEKGGLIRNYDVTIIIDTSMSCLGELSAPHALQTIKEILSSLSSIELPFFDLIVTQEKEPIVICSEVGTTFALGKKSNLWNSLLSALSVPQKSADLASALNTALELKRLHSSESTSNLFVLTDGLFSISEQKKISISVNNCIKAGMNVFGIGIGIYPKKIPLIFPKYVYSPNPKNVMKGVSSFFGTSLSDFVKEIFPIDFDYKYDIVKNINGLISSKDNPVFKDLVRELRGVKISIDAFDDFINMEPKNIAELSSLGKNPDGKNTELYTKDILKGQKILLVMLWSSDLSRNESEFVTPENLLEKSSVNRECVKTAVEFFGIEVEVVINYEDAINKITQQTKPGYCDYYAVWTFCGPDLPALPNPKKDPNYKPDPYLVEQYIDVLIQFWHNEGSLVFFAEGAPLTYQVNLFLEKAEFKNFGKSELRISGEHPGRQNLKGDNLGTLADKGTFNRKELSFEKMQRAKLSHNLVRIFEGITISYAQGDIKPFTAFSKDSDGGISSLFYCTDAYGRGDIVIDCGYTKCFTDMDKEGTFRYIQNIAGWTAHPEIHKIKENIDPEKWRPKAVHFTIDRNKKWTGFKEIIKDPKEMKTLFAIDSSKSVRGENFYHKNLKVVIDKYYKSGDIFYTWSSYMKMRTKDEIDNFIEKNKGAGGTSSYLIADIIKKEKSSGCQHLVIITDGKVSTSSIDKSAEKMNEYGFSESPFSFISSYIIGDKGNLSVGAPYCRNCPNKAYEINTKGERELVSVKPEDLNTLKDIDSIKELKDFISKYNSLDRAIQSKMLGSEPNKDLEDKLEKLKVRIESNNDEMNSSEKHDEFVSKIGSLIKMSRGALRNTFSLDSIAAAKKPV